MLKVKAVVVFLLILLKIIDMTNIVQYLDICWHTMKKLCDQGITPTQMVIKLSPAQMIDARTIIYGQGPHISARYVKGPFYAEIINIGLIKVSRGPYIFHLVLEEPYESITAEKAREIGPPRYVNIVQEETKIQKING